MDAKVTLSFDQAVAERAKKFAAENNISLSRLTEFLLRRVTETTYRNLEEMPISDWVTTLAEGEVEYQTKSKSRKKLKSAYFDSKK